MIEIGNYQLLRQLIHEDYTNYSGLVLKRYFRQLLAESYKYKDIGSWWDAKDKTDQHEIDIVAIGAQKNQAFAYEVKRKAKNYAPKVFETKIGSSQI